MSRRLVIYNDNKQTVIFDAIKHTNEKHIGIEYKEPETKRVRVNVADIMQLLRQPRILNMNVYYIGKLRPQEVVSPQYVFNYEVLVATDTCEIRDVKTKKDLTDDNYYYDNLVGTGKFLTISKDTFDELNNVKEQYLEDYNRELIQEHKQNKSA